MRRAAWGLLLVVFASGLIGGLYRGMKSVPDPDWRSFQKESRDVWEHRRIPPDPEMFGYLPATFFALWPFTVWLSAPQGLIAFVAANGLAVLISWAILHRWWFSADVSTDRAAMVWPLLLMIVHFQHVLQANQFTVWILLLCVTGLTLMMHGRDWTGGLALGLAGCIKVTPFVFLGYLLFRRRWRALCGMVVAVILFDILPSAAFFGIDGAIREHRAWLQRAARHSNRQMIERPFLQVGHRGLDKNFAYSIVLARWLRPMPEVRHLVILGGDPPGDVIQKTRADLRPDESLVIDPTWKPGTTWDTRRVRIPDVPSSPLPALSTRTIHWIWAGTLATGTAALILATLRCRKVRPGDRGWRAEAALWMMLMFWLSPMVRDYYLALALPAYLVTWRAVTSAHGFPRPARGRRLAIAALAFFCAAVIAWLWRPANWYGLELAAVAALTGATAWAWRAASIPREGPV